MISCQRHVALSGSVIATNSAVPIFTKVSFSVISRRIVAASNSRLLIPSTCLVSDNVYRCVRCRHRISSPCGLHHSYHTGSTSISGADISHLKQQTPPLIDKFDPFLQQIKDHGEGSITLSALCPDKVVDIVIDNPSKRNCLSGRMIYQLMTIIDSLSSDNHYSEAVAVLLRGSGSNCGHNQPSRQEETEKERETPPLASAVEPPPAFCAGLDFSLAKDVVNSPAQGLLMCSMMTEALNRFRALDMVSVALIHGPALGGGAELATACDYRVITQADSSRIGFVHGRLAASPGWGGGRRLVEIVGRNQALRLLGSARELSPQDAVKAGLADAVLDSPISGFSHVQQAVKFVEPFTTMPYPRAVKDLKLLVAGLSASSVSDDGQLEKDIFSRRWGSVDNMTALSSKK